MQYEKPEILLPPINLSNNKELFEENFLEYPITELLSKYGEGRHIPGSGSAAALTALLGIEMISTVCKKTIEKTTPGNSTGRFEKYHSRIDSELRPKLLNLYSEDISTFDRVYRLRVERDNNKKHSKKYKEINKEHLDVLITATEIPYEIIRISSEAINYAYDCFDNGYNPVRGDSGVAVSNLLSSISSSIFIIALNLKSFENNTLFLDWRVRMEKLLLTMIAEYIKSQDNLYQRIRDLNLILIEDKKGESNQLTFGFKEFEE